MSLDLIDRSTVPLLLKSDCLAGIITHPVAMVDDNKPLSHDASCPNTESGFFYDDGCHNNAWNEEGYILLEGLRNIDWKMQILYVHNQTYIDAIRKCHDLFNVPANGSSSVSYPLCGISFGKFNSAAGSSEICMRRSGSWVQLLNIFSGHFESLCDPLTGINVIAHIPIKFYVGGNSSQAATRYLMLAARMDSFGLIPDISPGEVSVVTSVIALLAVLQAVGKHLDSFKQAALSSDRHLLVAFFDGESFDYIGSSRAAFDMKRGYFPRKVHNHLTEQLEPIDASQLEGIIEVQQLGTGDGAKLYALADGAQVRNGQLNDLLFSLESGASAVGGTIVRPKGDAKMPPSSWHSFSRLNYSVPGVLLAPFLAKYNYRRVNSMLDYAGWNGTRRLTAISQVTVAANALLRAAADHVKLDAKFTSTLRVDEGFLSTLFECFVDAEDWHSCKFFNAITGWRFESERRNPTGEYGGKSTYMRLHGNERLRFYIEYISMYLTGTTEHNSSHIKGVAPCRSSAKKQNAYTYAVFTDPATNETHCYRTPVHLTRVDSPAFSIDGYNFSSKEYSTWTESVYNSDDLQLFFVEDPLFEYIFLAIGLMLVIASFLVVYRCTEESILVREEEEEQPDATQPDDT